MHDLSVLLLNYAGDKAFEFLYNYDITRFNKRKGITTYTFNKDILEELSTINYFLGYIQ